MSSQRRARDLQLLDALDELDPVEVDDIVWRMVRSGRDPLLGQAAGGRWDTGQFDVLYTALDPNGAIAEIHFHLSRQPVFPSKVEFTLNEIRVKTYRTLKFANLDELEPLGVEKDKYANILYERTQEIADAAVFLGFDGIIAPNARWQCSNLAIFSNQIGPHDLELGESKVIDWKDWRSRNKQGDEKNLE
jgi:hypothetical protein